MTLYERIMRARQAQVENEQKHDVQLAMINFTEDIPACPSCGSTEPDCLDECEVRQEIREADLAPVEVKWATENEVRDHWHGEIDAEWEEWVHEHYDHEG